MVGPQGQSVQVPFSKVRGAQNAQFQVAGNDASRYKKDAASAPSTTPESGVSSAISSSPLGGLLHPYKSIISPIGGLLGDALHGRPASDTNPIVQFAQGVVSNAKSEGNEAVGMAKQGSYGAAAAHALQAVPVLGSILQKAPAQAPGDQGSYLKNVKALATSPGMGTLIGGSATLALPVMDGIARIPGAASALDSAASSVPSVIANPINAIPRLPGAIVQAAGDGMQGAGVSTMDSLLKAGKKAYRYDAQPGLGVLQEGPGTSLALTKQGLSDKIAAARSSAGAAIPDAVQNSMASIPRLNVRNAINGVIADKSAVLSGDGGNLAAVKPLNDLQATFSPRFDAPGDMSAQELYGVKRNLDDNINWGRDMDPTDATVNNARRDIRSQVSQQLYQAAPELQAPSQRYSNLSSAAKLADARTFDQTSGLVNSIKAGVGMTAGVLTHGAGPEASLAAGLGTYVVPSLLKSTPLRSAFATGLFQGGRAVSAVGGALKDFGSILPLKSTSDDSTLVKGAYGDGQQNPNTAPDSSLNHGSYPQSAPYSMRNVTPEIIRPGQMSRSKFGVGADGRSGVLIRPLGALPAPTVEPPVATPYQFTPKPVAAIPATSPAQLTSSIGSRANLLPAKLLGDMTSPGTLAEQQAALRQAQLGSLGSVTPMKMFGRGSAPSRFEGIKALPGARTLNSQGGRYVPTAEQPFEDPLKTPRRF